MNKEFFSQSESSTFQAKPSKSGKVVTVGSEKDYCLPGLVPTCLEWVCCFQARHVSKLRNYPATDQHDKVRVRQVRATPAAAEVRGRGMVDCSSQRQL